MRISRAGLLVVIAIMIPILVEIRTVFAYVGIDLTPGATVLFGLTVIAAIVLWAVYPDLVGTDATADDVTDNGGRPSSHDGNSVDPACETDGGNER